MRKTAPSPSKRFKDRKNPQVGAFMGNAQQLYRQGQWAQSELMWHRVLKLEPGNPVALHGLGRLAMKQGRMEEAVKQMRQAADQGWQPFELVYDYATALLQAGHLEDAGTMYQEALKVKPKAVSCYVNMGIIRGMQQRHDEAVPFFRHALQLAPEDPEVLANCGSFMGSVGRYEEAREHFEKALKLAPGHVAAKEGLARAIIDQQAAQKAAEAN